jgi:electron transfer flavoprotein alpha subunit
VKTAIWVICVEDENEPGEHSYQLLNKASRLTDKNDSLISAICIGDYGDENLRTLSQYGADRVLYAKLPNEKCVYRNISATLIKMFEESAEKPRLILFPATDLSRCAAADFAIKIHAGLTAECINIEARKDGEKYHFISTRAAISSTVLAQIHEINTSITMCTCKKNVFESDKRFCDTSIPILNYYLKDEDIPHLKPRIISSAAFDINEINPELEKAEIVFGVGRGIKSKMDLEFIARVAKKYQAVIVGTRGLVEDGLIEKKWQVGQSGISISPELYVAIGISGATQHLVGIKNAKKVISINRDPNAPIFSFSDYCIVEDYKAIISGLMDCEETKSILAGTDS